MPASGMRSVTIVAKEAVLADALATAVFVLGPVEGMEFVESSEGVEALLIDAEGGETRSSGFAGVVEVERI